MTETFPLLLRVVRDQTGSVAVEFALLGPLIIAMLLGVLQVGVAMQSYNALRNVSADVARYASVQYQTDNLLSNQQLKQFAISRAKTAPYLLQANSLHVDLNDAATQRITGAREMKLTISYQIPSILTLMGYNSPSISYARPLFVVTP